MHTHKLKRQMPNLKGYLQPFHTRRANIFRGYRCSLSGENKTKGKKHRKRCLTVQSNVNHFCPSRLKTKELLEVRSSRPPGPGTFLGSLCPLWHVADLLHVFIEWLLYLQASWPWSGRNMGAGREKAKGSCSRVCSLSHVFLGSPILIPSPLLELSWGCLEGWGSDFFLNFILKSIPLRDFH